MSAWILGQIEIRDPARYAEYRKDFVQVLKKYGGELVCLADGVETVEGSWHGTRFAAARFASREAALGWYRSPEYQRLIEIRRGAVVVHMALAENQLG